MFNPRKAKAMLLLASLSLPLQLHAAAPQFEIDLKELDRQKPVQAPKPAKKQAPKQAPKRKQPEAAPKKKPAEASSRAEKPAPAVAARGEYVRYTVKPGDHIFKILMVHFGMSNDAAERLIPEIVRLNEIGNIKALKVGSTLLIPAQGKGEQARAARPARKGKGKRREAARPAEEAAAPRAPGPAAPERAAEPMPAPRAPEPTPAAPEPVPAPKAPEPAPAPKIAEPVPAAPAPPVAAAPVAPAPPRANVWICSESHRDAAKIIDSILSAVSATWSKNRIVESDKGFANPFSIRVDRYFEYKGGRYIVSIGESDPYNYTLIRLLETAGYKVLMVTGKEDFRSVSEKLFRLIGVEAGFGIHLLEGGKEASGYLVRQDDAGGREVLITDGPAAPGHKWVLPPGCGAK